MTAQPTPEEINRALARSRKARAGAYALAAQKDAEWLRDRASKAGKKSAANAALRRAVAEAQREEAGLPPIDKRRRYNRALPAEELLRNFYPAVDRDFPALTYDARRQKAAQYLKAERARLEAQ